MAKSEIDFARAANLLDVVQKVASVSPAYMALSSAAMSELKEMNDIATKEANAIAEERRLAEQEAKAESQAQHEKANLTTGKPFVAPKAIPATELVDRRI